MTETLLYQDMAKTIKSEGWKIMKEYTYKGYTFRKTNVIHANSGKNLYEIYGLKEVGQKPFLTSIRECREYIRECEDGRPMFRLYK